MENRRLDKKEASEIFYSILPLTFVKKCIRNLIVIKRLWKETFFLTKFQKTLYFNQSEKSF